MLVTIIISIGVKNQAPQVCFKLASEDSMSVSCQNFADMKYCDFMDILKDISDYRAQPFTLHAPMPSPPSYSITCSSPHGGSKDGDLLHSLGNLLLTYGAKFTTHGSMFKAATS